MNYITGASMVLLASDSLEKIAAASGQRRLLPGAAEVINIATLREYWGVDELRQSHRRRPDPAAVWVSKTDAKNSTRKSPIFSIWQRSTTRADAESRSAPMSMARTITVRFAESIAAKQFPSIQLDCRRRCSLKACSAKTCSRKQKIWTTLFQRNSNMAPRASSAANARFRGAYSTSHRGRRFAPAKWTRSMAPTTFPSWSRKYANCCRRGCRR